MTAHRPGIVFELPPERWLYCYACHKPWPCPDAPTDDLREGEVSARFFTRSRDMEDSLTVPWVVLP